LGVYFNFLYADDTHPTVKFADAWDPSSTTTETATLAAAIAKFTLADETTYVSSGWDGILAYKKQAAATVSMGALAGNWEGDDEELMGGYTTYLRITNNLLSVYMGAIYEDMLTYSGKIVEVTDTAADSGYIYIQFPGFTGTNQDYTMIEADENDYMAIYWSKDGDAYKFSVWNDDEDVIGTDLNTLKSLSYNNGSGAFGDLGEDPEDDMTGLLMTGVYVGFKKVSY
jgi:hypothetical protein